ncbi:fimbrillin family protein [uncultured Treponema sp.]|uniref:fimbrillin family protein n=1 Tax=uncultured Treponema sp. TaxID=162155 RepID=UPI0025D2BFDA|nr:fimbrillin family protein [uncultured Treponema sp.]
MIKARNYLFLAAAATLLLAGCQNGLEEESKGSSNVVTIRCNAGSPSSSRIASYSTDYDQMRYFEAGDQVCVSTDGQDPVVYQCTDADQQTWTEADSSKFLLWTDSEMTFKAYYPATEGTSMTSFTLPADQSTTGKIALADYMTRQQTGSNEYGNDINLNLERKMARVIVRISGFGSQYFDDQKTVSNVRIYSEASGIADGNPTGSSTEIQPYAQGNGGQGSTYTALVVPGYGDSGARFIQLTDGEGSTLLVKGIPELEAGNSYTFNLVVGKNRIEVASVTVTDWTTGETLAGGQAEEQGGASLSLTSPAVGQVIGSDGKNYAYGSLPTGVTKVAMIAYVSGSNGLAIALADEGSSNWATAKSTCEAKTPAFTNGTWHLPSQAEWNQMFSANGGSEESYSGLNTAITTAGGTTLQSGFYWSSSEYSPGVGAHFVHLDDGDVDWSKANESLGRNVRACLVFEVSGSAATLVTAITLNKTATTISAGQTETLSVSSVTPDDATDQTVTWSSDNEAVATVDADGKVTAVALGTANITATANDGSGVTATCAVTVSKVVTINQSDWGDGYSPSFTKDGVTVSAGMIDSRRGNLMDDGSFSTTLGNFTKIVVTTTRCYASGTGWSGGGSSMTWEGTPASTVSFSGEFLGNGTTQTTIVCTIVPKN